MHCAGGPTAEARGILNLSIQYWTSRGWAFVDVNYGGSTGTFFFFPYHFPPSFLVNFGVRNHRVKFEGYGREYRDRLLGRWGITDVDDCCSCAKFLVSEYFRLLLIMGTITTFLFI